jgi:hypothetical protein
MVALGLGELENHISGVDGADGLGVGLAVDEMAWEPTAAGPQATRRLATSSSAATAVTIVRRRREKTPTSLERACGATVTPPVVSQLPALASL